MDSDLTPLALELALWGVPVGAMTSRHPTAPVVTPPHASTGAGPERLSTVRAGRPRPDVARPPTGASNPRGARGAAGAGGDGAGRLRQHLWEADRPAGRTPQAGQHGHWVRAPPAVTNSYCKHALAISMLTPHACVLTNHGL